MHYPYFLLKLRKYNWHILSLYMAMAILLSTSLILSILLYNKENVTIFVPTTSSESFVFDGQFSPNYFENMALFLSQHIFSFYPQQRNVIERFLDPIQTQTLTDKKNKWTQPYTQHHIQGIFYPTHTTFIFPNKVRVYGTLKLFMHNTSLRTIPLNILLTFNTINGQCFLHQWTTEEKTPTT